MIKRRDTLLVLSNLKLLRRPRQGSLVVRLRIKGGASLVSIACKVCGGTGVLYIPLSGGTGALQRRCLACAGAGSHPSGNNQSLAGTINKKAAVGAAGGLGAGGVLVYLFFRLLLKDVKLSEYTGWLLLSWILVAIGLLVAAYATSLFLENQPGAWRWSGPGLVLLVVGGVFAAAGLWLFCTLGPQDKAVSAIKQLKGKVIVDETAPGKPVVRVDIDTPSKGRLGQIIPHLQALPHLRHLRITSMAFIDDTGLEHLQELTKLETLEVYSYSITESGVNNLKKRLPNVKVYHSPFPPPPLPDLRLLPRIWQPPALADPKVLLPDPKVLGNRQ
jgi:hypothetical protein